MSVAAAGAEFGRLDVVVANAGIASHAPALEMEEGTWQEMLDINEARYVTGVALPVDGGLTAPFRIPHPAG